MRSPGNVQGLMHCQPWCHVCLSGVDMRGVPHISGFGGTFIKYDLLVAQMEPEAWIRGAGGGVTSPRLLAEQGLSLTPEYYLDAKSYCPLSE